MSNNGYRLSRVQPMPSSTEGVPAELVTVDIQAERRWMGLVPTSSAREVNLKAAAGDDKKALSRFYPPLLLFSTLLTGVFFWLYITKPVMSEGVAPASGSAPGGASQAIVGAHVPEGEARDGGLKPFPDLSYLPGEEPSEEIVAVPQESQIGAAEETILSQLQTYLIDTGEIPLERVELEVPVLYESRTLLLDAATIDDLRTLAVEMEKHLQDVQIVRENGERIVAKYQSILSKSLPTEALHQDSRSRPEQFDYQESSQDATSTYEQ